MRSILDIFAQILSTLWAHKLRSFLTMFGIAWGVGSLLLLVGLGEGFRSGNKRELNEFGENIMFIFPGRAPVVQGSMSSARNYRLTYKDYFDLRKDAPHVRAATPVLTKNDVRATSEFASANGEITGIEPQYRGIRYLPMKQGRWFEKLLSVYDFTLRKVMRHGLATIGVAVLLFAGSLYFFRTMPTGFIPSQDGGFIFGVTMAGQDISFESMAKHHRALARHDIGYHSNTHSIPPAPSVYLRDLDWLDGAAEFARRETRLLPKRYPPDQQEDRNHGQHRQERNRDPDHDRQASVRQSGRSAEIDGRTRPLHGQAAGLCLDLPLSQYRRQPRREPHSMDRPGKAYCGAPQAGVPQGMVSSWRPGARHRAVSLRRGAYRDGIEGSRLIVPASSSHP